VKTGKEIAHQMGMELLSGPPSIEERFREFHAAHPEVYTELVKLARQAKAAGRTRIGMKLLFEVVRWNSVVNPDRDGDFKINNIFSSRYVRMIKRHEPDLAEMFATRELRSECLKVSRPRLIERLAS